MNRRSFIKTGLLWLPAVAAGQSVYLPNGRKAFRPVAAAPSGNPTPIYSQNWEGGHTDWAESGTVDFHASTSGLSLESSNCLHTGAEITQVYSTGLSINHGELWTYFLFRPHANTGQTSVFTLCNNSYSAQLSLYLESNLRFTINATGASGATTVSGGSIDTTYSVWLHYKKVAVSSDAIAEVWFSAATTKPADGSNNHAKVSNGTGTANIQQVNHYINGGFGGQDFYWDKFRIYDAAVGSDPS